MAKKRDLDEPEVYYIPNNFISKGTVMGGTFKTRNLIEALILVIGIGYPIFLIPMNTTVKIVLITVLCLPLGITALLGVNNGPLSQFIVDFIKFKKIPQEFEYDATHSDIKNGSGYVSEPDKRQEKNKQRKGGIKNVKE